MANPKGSRYWCVLFMAKQNEVSGPFLKKSLEKGTTKVEEYT